MLEKDSISSHLENDIQNKNIIDRKMTHLEFQVALVEGLVAGHTETRRKAGRPSLGLEPARLTERHFVDYIPEKERKKCVVRELGKVISNCVHGVIYAVLGKDGVMEWKGQAGLLYADDVCLMASREEDM